MAELVYAKDGRLLFTKEMKEEYTLLMPQMLPVHFGMFRKLLELEGYKERCAKWEGGAKAYDDLKDRTATIELEARQRARAIESAAEEKAKKLRTEAEQILYKVQAGYGRLRGDVDATITHASGELGRVDKALEQVRSEFAEHDASLERLLQSCREATRRVPEPVPLKES